MTNLASVLVDTAQEHGDLTAIKLDDVDVSDQQVDEGSARVAGLLESRGVGPGDRVGIMLPNVPYFALASYGALRAGATVVPMNVLLKGREVRFHLEDPEARLLFAWGDIEGAATTGAGEAGTELVLVKPGESEQLPADAELDREVADCEDDDTAVILYTSGTTGKPKDAELTHANLIENTEVIRNLAATTADDIWFTDDLPKTATGKILKREIEVPEKVEAG